jgi:hypothetical protein
MIMTLFAQAHCKSLEEAVVPRMAAMVFSYCVGSSLVHGESATEKAQRSPKARFAVPSKGLDPFAAVARHLNRFTKAALAVLTEERMICRDFLESTINIIELTNILSKKLLQVGAAVDAPDTCVHGRCVWNAVVCRSLGAG